MDGGLIAGDAGGFLNSMRLKGIHLAMRTGMLAAEAAFEAIREGDTSAASLKRYQDKIDAGPVRAELYPGSQRSSGVWLWPVCRPRVRRAVARDRWTMVREPAREGRPRAHEDAGVVLRPGRARITNQQRDDHRSEADVRQAHQRPLLRNGTRRGSTFAPARADRGLHVGLRTRIRPPLRPLLSRRTSTRSSASPASPCACRSTRRTACTARRATSWIPTR